MNRDNKDLQFLVYIEALKKLNEDDEGRAVFTNIFHFKGQKDDVVKKTIMGQAHTGIPRILERFGSYSFEQPKCFILDLGHYGLRAKNYEFSKTMRDMLAWNPKNHSYFLTGFDGRIGHALICANLELNFGDVVFVVLNAINSVEFLIFELKFTEHGYERTNNLHVLDLTSSETIEELKGDLFKNGAPKHAILVTSEQPSSNAIKILNPDKIVFHKDLDAIHPKFVIETSKWMLDKGYTKFHLLPKSEKVYHIYFIHNGKEQILASIWADQNLPYTQAFGFRKWDFDLHIATCEEGGRNILQTFKPIKESHRCRITVTIDTNNFASFKFQPIIHPKIQILPQLFNQACRSKDPVVVFLNNLSFICVWDEKLQRHKFLESWNGQFGKELFISFDHPKPRYFDKAKKAYLTKPASVVYDLIKILSMPPNQLFEKNKFWDFTFTKTDEHPILIEFENFDGTRKAQTPKFLMAMLLKQMLKFIKAEIGEKPDGIAFYIFGDEFDDETREAIAQELCESFDLLKVCGVFLMKKTFGF